MPLLAAEYAILVKQAIESVDEAHLAQLLAELKACRRRGSTIYLFGNGGSAATASHLACDLAKGSRRPDAPPLRVVALTDNVPVMTAWANDASYESIFAEQLRNLVRPGDVAIAISCSGNSPNALAGVEVAKQAGAFTVGFSDQRGGKLVGMVDLALQASGPFIQVVEDAHMALGHLISISLRDDPD